MDVSGVITTVAGTGTNPTSNILAGDGGSALGADIRPADVAVDPEGNLYIADAGHNAIRKVDTAGIISTVAGIGGANGFSGDNGPAVSAQLAMPYSYNFV